MVVNGKLCVPEGLQPKVISTDWEECGGKV
jgi:hypothetical protein